MFQNQHSESWILLQVTDSMWCHSAHGHHLIGLRSVHRRKPTATLSHCKMFRSFPTFGGLELAFSLTTVMPVKEPQQAGWSLWIWLNREASALWRAEIPTYSTAEMVTWVLKKCFKPLMLADGPNEKRRHQIHFFPKMISVRLGSSYHAGVQVFISLASLSQTGV